MPGFTEDQKKKLLSTLEGRGVKLPCPRCGNNRFTLIDGYLNHPLQLELSGMVIGGPSIPSVGVVCENCGYLSQHALGVLGLLPKANQ